MINNTKTNNIIIICCICDVKIKMSQHLPFERAVAIFPDPFRSQKFFLNGVFVQKMGLPKLKSAQITVGNCFKKSHTLNYSGNFLLSILIFNIFNNNACLCLCSFKTLKVKSCYSTNRAKKQLQVVFEYGKQCKVSILKTFLCPWSGNGMQCSFSWFS